MKVNSVNLDLVADRFFYIVKVTDLNRSLSKRHVGESITIWGGGNILWSCRTSYEKPKVDKFKRISKLSEETGPCFSGTTVSDYGYWISIIKYYFWILSLILTGYPIYVVLCKKLSYTQLIKTCHSFSLSISQPVSHFMQDNAPCHTA